MNSIDGLKTCRKGLHQYPPDKKRCPNCQREWSRRWQEKNKKQLLDNVRSWNEQNKDRVRENRRRWREKNRDRVRETKRCWNRKNSDKVRASVMLRITQKKNATPPWADQAAIKAIYAEAVRLEQKTGIRHHVDHIYPLTSPYVCGLHVAENLQILPGPENLSKGNRTWPGQLECQRLPLKENGFDLES